jgi:hypothetical protein
VSPWKVILATMVIFGCGVVTGAILITTVGRSHSPGVETILRPSGNGKSNPNNPPSPLQIQRVEFLRRMEKQLNLTADQRERIGKIIRASQDRTKPLWDIIAPQMRKEVKRVQEEIKQELTPDQQIKFAELLKPRRRPDASPSQPAVAQPAEPSRTN